MLLDSNPIPSFLILMTILVESCRWLESQRGLNSGAAPYSRGQHPICGGHPKAARPTQFQLDRVFQVQLDLSVRHVIHLSGRFDF